MKKSELNPCMLLETRCGEKMRFIRDCFVTDKLEILDQDAYTEDLIYAYNDEKHDIVKVYEEDSEAVKWERQEIDWDKVPIGTKVIVRNSNNENWKERYFITKTKTLFYAIEHDYHIAGHFTECKLAEEPVTVEGMVNLIPCTIDDTCKKPSGTLCKNCIAEAILKNYNLIRK